MTDSLRRALDYIIDLREVTLVSRRQLYTSLTPRVMGKIQWWKSLLFLMACDTGHLSQNLYVPWGLNRTATRMIIDFVSKRGGATITELAISAETISDICSQLGVARLPTTFDATRYIISSVRRTKDTEVSFPDFATRIEMSYSKILNIPSRLVTLKLHYVMLGKPIMEAIGEARFMTFLEIFDDIDIVFCGFPQYLEELTIACEQCSITYTEGYAYDCTNLRKLEATGSSRFTNFPDHFVDSVANTLTTLKMTGYREIEQGYIPTILRKLVKLTELSVAWDPTEETPISPLIEILTIREPHDPAGARVHQPSWKSLPHLRIACIPMSEEFGELLNGSPNLEELTLTTWGPSFALPERPHRALTTLSVSNKRPDDQIYWKPLSSVLLTFPNLITYEYLGPGIRVNALLLEKHLSVKMFSTLIQGTSNKINASISMLGTNFEQLDITLQYSWGRYISHVEIRLPRTMKRVTTVVFEGYGPPVINMHNIVDLCSRSSLGVILTAREDNSVSFLPIA